jgi:hypothetical protein
MMTECEFHMNFTQVSFNVWSSLQNKLYKDTIKSQIFSLTNIYVHFPFILCGICELIIYINTPTHKHVSKQNVNPNQMYHEMFL